jgi:outer membrane protein assembly factor BamD
MIMIRFTKLMVPVVVVTAFFAASCGVHKKYENPITKNTQQPDKVLFDKSIKDIEKGRFEVARLTLNTLINTYDTSEFLAKAKLAIADSWYREGGTHGLAQAEAEYKDFILFYPGMEEAAESQKKICDIHFKQMEKADRDANNALRAEQECRTLITQFPNSKYVPQTEQELREIQEVLAQEEFIVGGLYAKKGANPAAANRYGGLVDQYPLFSRADLSLWNQADAYSKMGPRFRTKEGESLARLVKEYPLSPYADQAKKKLSTMEMPIPEADPTAVARMKFEQENRTKSSLVSNTLGFMKSAPDVKMAAHSGTPTMTNPKPTIPASVPTQVARQRPRPRGPSRKRQRPRLLRRRPRCQMLRPRATLQRRIRPALRRRARRKTIASRTRSRPRRIPPNRAISGAFMLRQTPLVRVGAFIL